MNTITFRKQGVFWVAECRFGNWRSQGFSDSKQEALWKLEYLLKLHLLEVRKIIEGTEWNDADSDDFTPNE